MSNAPKLGSESFWEMVALAMAGGLASCRSCVEHYYFQSYQNAGAFLDSCVAGRLLERVSLLDLYGDVGPRPAPSLRQSWYDEPIYISAPRFRRLHLDVARERLESTKRAVLDALRLYHEELGADDNAILAAYANAITESMLRHSELARERKDVDMSPIARLRLIQDGFRKDARRERPRDTREEIESAAAKRTVEYVNRFIGKAAPETSRSDRLEELQKFTEEFLGRRHSLDEFWKGSYGQIPVGFERQWLPVVKELFRHCYESLLERRDSKGASEYFVLIQDKTREAQKGTNDRQYASALSEFRSDLETLVSDIRKQAA